MAIKTINFLPEIFRSTANQKFLNATLDQLVSQPDFNKENGYIGRKFAPTFTSTDNYITETTDDRQNYQLEPSVVSTDVNGNVQFFNSYMDLIQQIKYYNGITSNHSRLFSQEAYTYDEKYDFDKLVNFSQYYWLPTGPDPVTVYPALIPATNTFDVTRNSEVTSYNFSNYGTLQNPDIILVRGGTYQFKVNQSGYPFWIQTEPGVSGTYLGQNNVSTRDVLGVVDNGLDSGTITFNVPLIDAQNFYVNMILVQAVDFATTMQYTDVNGKLAANVTIDGIGAGPGGVNFVGKSIVFISDVTSEPTHYHSIWNIQVVAGVISLSWVQDIPVDYKVFIKSGTVYANNEFYKTVTGTLAEVPLITAPLSTLYYNDGVNQSYSGRILLVDAAGYTLDVDDVILGKKGYISPNGVTFTNGLKVTFGINVVPASYVGNSYYVEGVGTDDGIELISINDLATPELNTAGSSTPFDTYGYDEDKFDQSLNGPQTPDYITINRSSIDNNAWSRGNRWFHTNVISATATYNDTIPLFNQLQRAERPIIEFNEDLLLFNYGRNGRPGVDYLDFSITDALTEIEGPLHIITTGNIVANVANIIVSSNVGIYPGMTVSGNGIVTGSTVEAITGNIVTLNNESTITSNGSITFNSVANQFSFEDGMTAIFANDFDPIVNNKIFTITLIDNSQSVHLVEVTGGNIQAYDSVSPNSGTTVELLPITDVALTYNPSSRKLDPTANPTGLTSSMLTGVVGTDIGLVTGVSFWYNGTSWIMSQQKTGLNQAPLFDIIDNNSNSLSDKNIYNSSSFVGSKIFSYLEGTGINDPVLGFPLSYQNFNNQGDIEFQNNFDVDTFTHLVGLSSITNNINQGFIASIDDTNVSNLIKENIWVTKIEDTKQYQIISYTYDGVISLFTIDILPDEALTVPNLKVFVNFKLLDPSNYSIVTLGVYNYISITSTLTAGDQIVFKIYSSTQVSNLGYYEIPSNLEFNALNQDFTILTLGQLRNHVITLSNNNNQVVGLVPGDSNLRDLEISNSGGSILQHSAPVIYSSLFLLNKDLNFIDSISYAQREYSKFKNRFFEAFGSMVNAGITDPVAGVDFILGQLNAIKNKLSPWYYSDMVPYGGNYTNIDYTVLSIEQTEYEINSIFNDTELSNTAVLVYVNGIQLLKDIDYTFNQTRPTVVFNITLNYGDAINFRVYSNTDGCFIPDTPTKLGLYPKFTPETFATNVGVDLASTTVIQGHDGSLTQAFGDMRDDLLLELEKRIYNNIKVTYNTENFDIYNYIPGKFRNTEYNLTEFNQILSRCFLTWLGSNRIDYSTNSWFENNNAWSWTYNRFKDVVDGSYLLGYWRGIYKYFYDTDAPNERPWESLGFGQEPDWWQATYGPAPYTGGNLVLWKDLEQGIIRQGSRAGTYAQYARPGLSKVIPVDDSGNLRPPNEFLVTGFNGADVSDSFVFGDEGPVETAWRRSSDYPYALQQALCLMKPGMYFGQLSNTQTYSKTNGISQFVIADTKQRITPDSLIINGATVSGVITRNAGYLNWIADYVTGYGSNAQTQIQNYLSTLDVQLGYRAAGFTDKPYLTLLAEQSSPSSTNNAVTIPNENYQVYVHKSSPVARLIYSAVIVEKTSSGYTVSGYSTEAPYFTILPSIVNNNFYTVNVSGATGIIYNDAQSTTVTIPYGYEFLNKQQVVDFLTSYSRYLSRQGFQFTDFDQNLQQTKNWILSAKEYLTWTQQGWAPGNIIVLSPISNSITVLTTDSVVDEIDNSPMGSKVLDVGFNVVKSNIFTVLRDGGTFTLTADPRVSIGLIDLSLVQYEDALVFDNTTSFSDVIYQPSTGNRQFRLKYIGYKTNEWIGQLNPPGFIYSNPSVNSWHSGQDYLTGDIVMYNKFMYSALQDIDASNTFNPNYWTQLDSSTFKTGMLPNLSYNAEKSENYYDVDNQVEDQDLNMYSMGLIGYRDRAYLDNLRLNSTSQVKFYQGFIKDKGTANAINALANANFDNLSGSMKFYEEWAFRVGEYGATQSNQFVEVQLSDSKYIYNPIALQLLNVGEVSNDPTVLAEYDNTLYKKPLTYKTNIFEDRTDESIYENDIKTAGYVNLKDINATIFDIQNYQDSDSLVSKIYSGYRIWVAKDNKRDWNVYRVTETSSIVTNILYALDSYATITTNIAHNLSVGDIFAVRNFNTNVDGFYTVSKINSLNTVYVSITSALETIMQTTPSISGSGALFVLHSMRVAEMSDIAGFTPNNGWSTIDKLWVDSDEDTSEWAVYQKNEPWSYTNELVVSPTSQTVGNSIVFSTGIGNGSSIATSSNGSIAVSGAPETDNGAGNGTGTVKVFVKTLQGLYAESASLIFSDPDCQLFGTAVDIAQETIVVGAPGSYGNQGTVIVYNVQTSGVILPMQVISDPALNDGDNFGTSVSFSDDATILYVGAPGTRKVYSFNLTTLPPYSQVITTNGIDATYALNFTPYSTDSTLVNASTDVLMTNVQVPNIDYTVSGNTVTFLVNGIPTPPGVGNYQIVQGPYYKQTSVIADPTTPIQLGDNFGQVIDTQGDGSTVVIGAPNKSVNSIVDTGAAYLFNQVGDLLQEFVVSNLPYNAKFGSAVTISTSGAEIFISAPGYNVSSYHGGQVYRFTNAGITYNTIIGTSPYAGNTLFDMPITINGIDISIPHLSNVAPPHLSNVAVALSTIQSYNIVGLTVTVTNDYLTLTYASKTSERLTVFGRNLLNSNSLTDLGLPTPYIQTQVIQHPYSDQFEKLGTALDYSETQKTLIVGSEGAPTIEHTIIDSGTTTFDGGALVLFDQIPNTGAVYLFEELGNSNNSISSPTQYGFIQEIINPDVKPGDNFGSAVAIDDTRIFVGANNASTQTYPNTGRIYYFSNADSIDGWSLLRYQQPQVDLDNITRIFLYNNTSQTILTNLDYIDPAKGKILGVAEQDISYKTEFDPAAYNTGANTTVAFSQGFNWGEQQVGRVWWNLDLVRYIDYEQDTLTYRINNWGTVFPGSVIEINEWVKSSVIPSQYTGDGTVKYADNSAYVTSMMVDTVTGNIVTNYYFWVTNKTTFDSNLPSRRSSALAIASFISSPVTQSIPYAALIQDNAIALFSSNQYISSNNTILHIDYALLQNNNIIHNEYELIQENSSTAILPTRIINKFIDSITGADYAGNLVPDATLSVAERYGISIRPRQTMFVNRLAATENFVEYVNNIFIQNPIVEQFDLSQLYLAEPTPLTWDPVANKNISVANYTELSYIDVSTLVVGQRILVESDINYNNQWDIYEYEGSSTFKVVRIQNYQTTDYWSKVDWFDPTYDSTVKPTYTVATLNDMSNLTLVSGDIVWITNNGLGQFAVYRVNPDLTTSLVGIQNGTIQLSDALWAHDTHEIGYDNDSFDTVKFDQDPTIEFRNIINALKDNIFINTLQGKFNDLFFMLLNYMLSEQRMIDWAFKTSFVSVIQNLRKLEQYPSYIEDNQTYYQDYINEVKPYRTTIREYVIDYTGNDTADIHPTDFDLPAYYDTTLKMWRSPSGEQPGDANLLATQIQYADWEANHTFSIGSVQIEDGGYGYSAPPELKVEGGGGTGAVLQAVIDTFSGSVTDIIVVKPGTNFTSTPTIIAFGDGVDINGHQTLRCYPMLVNAKIRTFDTTLKFDRVSYSSTVKQWTSNTTFTAGDIVVYNDVAYTVNATGNSGAVFLIGDYTVLPDDQLKTAADRVMAFYTPTVGMPAKDLTQLFAGTDYPGNLVDGSLFVGNVLPQDTDIQGPSGPDFGNLIIGTRPEDINIVGGAFVDTYSSHAPEELLPGMIYDTLDIKVFTVNTSNPTNNPIGYRITQKMSNDFHTTFDVRFNTQTTFDSRTTTFDGNPVLNSDLWEFRRISAANTTTLTGNLLLTDTEIHVTNASVLPVPDPLRAIPGTIYIDSEKITYFTIDLVANTLGQIRRGVWGTGTPSIHTVGTLVVDASANQQIPGNAATSTWLDMITPQLAVGNGLMLSNTEQAIFLKASPTYLP